jgi:pSer/pThr/pTyr-binding forkhead associated (FHA) protein
MARLVVITKGLAVAPHELNDQWITIGRAEENVFQIDEPTVSNKHCEARLTGGELVVRDTRSTNGTFVDGEKITEGKLKPGQTLRLGLVELRLEIPAPAVQVAPGTTKMPTLEPPKPAPVAPPRAPVPPVAAVAPKITPPQPPQPAPAPSPIPAAKPVAPPPRPFDPGRQFQVLFVDDSRAFLEIFTDLCVVYSKRTWEIHTAPTADLALKLLQKIPMDLVVLDIVMPLLDGLQLMGDIRSRHPAIKLAVMTASVNESKRADALANGADLFIEKPTTPDGIKTVFTVLNDLVSGKTPDAPQKSA